MRRVTALTVISALALPGMVAWQNAPSALAEAAGAGHAVAHPTARTASARAESGRRALSRAGTARMKLVRYAGYSVEVPAAWPVYRLDRDPSQCVRYDIHAVYLGQPGAYQQCPAHLVGRTGTVSMQAGGSVAGPADGWQMSTLRTSAGAGIMEQPQAGEIRAVYRHNVTVTGTYGTDASVVSQIIGSVKKSSGQRPASAPGPGGNVPGGTGPGGTGPGGNVSGPAMATGAWQVTSGPAAGPRHTGHKTVTGAVKGFDACNTPPLHAMRRWYPRFSAAGIYIGGPEAACGWGNLSPTWVQKTTALGWALMPTYVGPQAPCTGFQVRIKPADAEQEGRDSASAAISLAQQLGLGTGAPIYDDMESYPAGWRCRRSVLSFLDGWTRELHSQGYRSGVYSSAGAAVMALASHTHVGTEVIEKPDSVWFALWDEHANLDGMPYLPDTSWGGAGERTKQWLGGHNRWFHGVRLNIDSDVVAGAVYRNR